MRDGLDAPVLELPAATAERIRDFLDAQSPIRLAVWVRHEQQGRDGPAYDHHLVLGVDDEVWENRDMRALDAGLRVPSLGISEPTWVDLFPATEVEELRSFGTVLWEQGSPGADPLDYRFTFEPFEPDDASAERFAAEVDEARGRPACRGRRLAALEGRRRGRIERSPGGRRAPRGKRADAGGRCGQGLDPRRQTQPRVRYREAGRLDDDPVRGSDVSLEMRAACERCETPLEPDGAAVICSHECTFCAECGEAMGHVCPNCGGELVARPRRVAR